MTVIDATIRYRPRPRVAVVSLLVALCGYARLPAVREQYLVELLSIAMYVRLGDPS